MTPQHFEEDSQIIEHKISQLIKLIRERKRLVVSIYIFFIALAIVYCQFTQKQYKSSLTGFSNYLKSNQVKHIVSDLQLLLKANKPEIVAQYLNLPVKTIKHLKSIEVFDQTDLSKKITDDELNFQINVVITDMNILDSLERSLTAYISNINFVKRRLKLDITDLTDERDVLKNEIKYIDSAKFLLLKKINSADNKGVILSNLGEVISTKMEMEKKLKENEKKLRFIEDFQIVKSFDKSYNKVSPKLSIALIVAVILATISLYMYFFFGRVLKHINEG